MKNTAILICLLLLNISTYSQYNQQIDFESKNSLKLYFLNGYGVIYQFNDSKTSSFRFHIDLSTQGFDSNLDQNSSTFSDDTSSSNSNYDESETSFTIQISPQYYFNIITKDYFNFYAGGGPFFSYGFSNSTRKNISTDTYSANFYSYSSSHSKKYDLGLIFFIGIETKINDHLGIFSEIDVKGGKSWMDNKRNSEQRFIPDNDSKHFTDNSEEKWFYELSKVKLGIYILL